MKRLFASILFIIVLSSCTKKNEPADPDNAPKFSYEFNGKKYSGSGVAGYIVYNNSFNGIVIEREDLFGGTISFHKNSSLSNNCAYLTPTGQQFVVQQPGCIFYNYGNPIDSVKVYFYRSGIMNYSTSNCKHKKEPDLVFGGYIEYDVCDINGTFSLTLGNKNNQTIVITNGSFTIYEIRP